MLLSLLPIVLGVTFYTFFGYMLFSDLLPWIKEILRGYLDSPDIGIPISYLLTILLSVFFYFMINWTFLICVSLISSPFNDLVCRKIHSSLNQEIGSEDKMSFARAQKIISNEIKKMLFIIMVSLFSLILGFIPILTPLSFILTAALFSASFLDYSWSNKEYSFRKCVLFLWSNLWVLISTGLIFIFFMSIPILNLIIFPFAVIYYSVLFVKIESYEKDTF